MPAHTCYCMSLSHESERARGPPRREARSIKTCIPGLPTYTESRPGLAAFPSSTHGSVRLLHQRAAPRRGEVKTCSERVWAPRCCKKKKAIHGYGKDLFPDLDQFICHLSQYNGVSEAFFPHHIYCCTIKIKCGGGGQ